jgi:hypothetical protein
MFLSMRPFWQRARKSPRKARHARDARPILESLEGRALLTPLIANANGVTGTIGNALWHYQDNGGWYNLHAPGTVASMVDSHDPFGREELFVRLTTGEVWDFVYATGQWHDTGKHLDMMVANANGVTGTLNGVLYHYQDNGGWYFPKAPGTVLSMVDSHDPYGREELFADVWNGLSISTWAYVYSTGQWHNTGGDLSGMIANANGVTGTIGNTLWHYQDNGGWYNLHAPGTVASMVDSHDPFGREELFVRLTTGEVWDFVYATGQWHDTGRALNTMSADSDGVTGLWNGDIWHYQDNSGWSFIATPQYQAVYVVVSHDPYGREELFVPMWDTSLWDYVPATGQWHNTGVKNPKYWE